MTWETKFILPVHFCKEHKHVLLEKQSKLQIDFIPPAGVVFEEDGLCPLTVHHCNVDLGTVLTLRIYGEQRCVKMEDMADVLEPYLSTGWTARTV